MQPAISKGKASVSRRGSARPWNCSTAASMDRYTPTSTALPTTTDSRSGMRPRRANSRWVTALSSSPSAHSRTPSSWRPQPTTAMPPAVTRDDRMIITSIVGTSAAARSMGRARWLVLDGPSLVHGAPTASGAVQTGGQADKGRPGSGRCGVSCWHEIRTQGNRQKR